MPGPLGEVYPKSETVKLENGRWSSKPAFDSRRIWLAGSGRYISHQDRRLHNEWARRNRCGGHYYSTGHAWGGLLDPRNYFEKHPEYYSLVCGERRPTQLCTTNADTIRLVLKSVLDRFEKNPRLSSVSLSPNDGGGFCQCTRCTSLDPGNRDPIHGQTSITDRLILFFNEIARGVEKKFPDKVLPFYAYSRYTLPPVREKLHPMLMPFIAPINYCRYHALGSGNCASRRLAGYICRGWAKAPSRFGYREYNFNLADTSLPYTKIHIWSHDVPLLYQLGCRAFSIESIRSWTTNGLHKYVLAKLLWDPELDTWKAAEQYCRSAYGGGWKPMLEFYHRLAKAYENLNCHTGDKWFAHHLFTPGFLKESDELLKSALKKPSRRERRR